MKLCSVDTCEKKHYCKTFCSKHYQVWFKYGDPLYHEKNTPLAWIQRNKDYSGDDCLLWPHAKLTNGYGVIRTPDGRKRISSRVMCEVAHGMPPSENMQAAHSCGKGHLACMNPGHLSWKSAKGNSHDKYLHGTHLFGERAPWSLITERDAARIIYGSESVKSLADKLGISKWTIYKIRQGKIWRHIHG